FGVYDLWWYHQAPGGRPEWVSFISLLGATKKYGEAVQVQAAASQGNSVSESSLSLCALRPRDSARYFCAVHRG
ncbi:Ig heavy chain V region C3, partial [Megadyptes antipodes antipodes]